MKAKRVLSVLISAAIMASLIPNFGVSADGDAILLSGSEKGQTIGTAGCTTDYYVSGNTKCTAEDAGVSGLSIASGATVNLTIPAGVTLTCTGGEGSVPQAAAREFLCRRMQR